MQIRPATPLMLMLVTGCGDALSSDLGALAAGPAFRYQRTLVDQRSDWRYWHQGEDLGTTWREPDWEGAGGGQSGTGPLGYGEDYVNAIPCGHDHVGRPVTVYFRRSFYVEDPRVVEALRVEVMYDDGFVFYLNGEEGGRAGMPIGEVTSQTLATGHEAHGSYVSFDATALRGKLHAGWNTLAVEVHQQTASSSDLVFDAALVAEVRAPMPAPLLSLRPEQR